MNHGKLTRFLSRILFVVLLGLGALPALGFYVRLHNGTAGTVTFYIKVGAANSSSSGVGAGATFEKNMGTGAYVGGAIVTVWTVNYGNTPVYRADGSGAEFILPVGGNTDTTRAPTSPDTYSTGGVPPNPDSRFDVVVINGTHLGHTYVFRNADLDTQLASYLVFPGADVTFSLRNQASRFAVSVTAEDTAIPPFFVLWNDDDTAWQLEDDPANPGGAEHTYTTAAPENKWTLDFTPDPSDTNSAAALTEGTFKAGVESQFAQAREQGQETLLVLKEIKDNLGGSGLTTAAGSVSNAATSLGTAAAAMNLAGTNMVLAASALGEAATNLLAGQTNLAQRVADGSQVETNMGVFHEQGVTQYGALSNSLITMKGDIGALTNLDAGGGGNLGSFWLVDVPHFGEVDFNPMSDSRASLVASWTRVMISWLSQAFLLAAMMSATKKAIAAVGGFQQGRSPVIGASVLGTGFQSSIPTHLPIFFVIAGVSLSFMATLVTYMATTGSVVALGTSPFAASNQMIIEGMWLLNQFVPVGLLIVHFITRIVFNLIIALGLAGVQIVLRAMPSCIFLAFLCWPAMAGELRFENHTSETVALHSDGVYFAVPTAFRGRFTNDVVLRDAASNVVATFDLSGDYVVRGYAARDESSGVVVAGFSVEETIASYFWLGLKMAAIPFGLFGATWILRMIKATGPEGQI